MKKLGLMLLVLLAGCSADYSVALGNGYSYEHWGNNFIARTVAGEQRQIITGQVDSYLKKDTFVLAAQTRLPWGRAITTKSDQFVFSVFLHLLRCC